MKQYIVNRFETTSNPEDVTVQERSVINCSTALGMDLLMKAIEDRVPVLTGGDKSTTTRKTILSVSRGEGPYYVGSLDAFVLVETFGLQAPGSDEVEGFYRVHIEGRGKKQKSHLFVEKLERRVVYDGKTDPMPQKDYSSVKK